MKSALTPTCPAIRVNNRGIIGANPDRKACWVKNNEAEMPAVWLNRHEMSTIQFQLKQTVNEMIGNVPSSLPAALTWHATMSKWSQGQLRKVKSKEQLYSISPGGQCLYNEIIHTGPADTSYLSGFCIDGLGAFQRKIQLLPKWFVPSCTANFFFFFIVKKLLGTYPKEIAKPCTVHF